MLLSYNWLKELVPNLTQNPKELADLLTAHSYETVISSTFALDGHIKVVRIESIEPHPNADRLRLATVTDGEQTIKVVCGAPNIEVGQLVPYAPPGTKVLDKDGQLFELTVAKIRGVESPGMLNSRRELGLGNDHDGIFVLPADTPLNSKLSDHIPSDTILEADITPNRAHDSLGHLGVAREIIALTGLKIAKPERAQLPAAQEKVSDWQLGSIHEAAPRYMNMIVTGIKNSSSPLWLQSRLMMLDQKPINALVDITNYVMFERINPSHAFDAATLPGKTMGVRVANPEEKITLLDGSQPSLSATDLVITSDDKPVALAGVMGGQGTEVNENTSEAVIEIANFEPYTIQKTALSLGKRTEAAARFLKGIDPNIVATAAARIAYLIQTITGGKVQGVLDYYPHPWQPTPVSFRPARVSAIAGTPISSAQSKQALTGLRFTIEETNEEEWQVTPPTHRLDIIGEHDVVEEVIFQVGLDNIPANPADASPQALAPRIFAREKIRDFLVQKNLTETYNYSFENAKTAAMINIPAEPHLRLSNPIAPELANLRTSHLPGLLANMIKNKPDIERQNTVVERGLFEIGHVFYPVKDTGEGEAMAAVSVTPLNETLKELITYLNVPGVTYEEPADNPFIKNNVVMQLNGERLGWMGQIQPAVAKKTKYRLPLYAFELNLEVLMPHVPASAESVTSLADIQSNTEEPVQYEELNRYPSVFRDISVLVEADTPTEKIHEVIERVGGELLSGAELFDEYEPDDEGQPNEGKKKSLSFHLEYQAKDRTLTDKEISAIQNTISKAVQEELGAEIR